MRSDRADRADQTDPGAQVVKSRSDRWNAEAAERQRAEPADGIGRSHGEADGGRAEAAAAPESWQEVKSRFVDDPAGAIAAAEVLVQRAVERQRRALEAEAAAVCAHDGDGKGENDASSTETLRTRLIRYQAFCERLAGGSAHST